MNKPTKPIFFYCQICGSEFNTYANYSKHASKHKARGERKLTDARKQRIERMGFGPDEDGKLGSN